MRLTKVLMEGRSGVNLFYVKTYDAIGLLRATIWPSNALFHLVVPGIQAIPLEQVNLHVMFGSRANFHTEMLTFDIADFPGSYHVILGWPCYAKFMAIPNYTYLKIKIPGPCGIITMGGNIR
ncbi:uncharacterized protein [Miscanthus floridulus]|uniref:uncharacterized protein n=1 Tax=Miscanthus floridulus TaxID=154761 RepID=UPI003458D923